MSEIKTRAELFEAAAKMMRMCDDAGIDHTYKVGMHKLLFSSKNLSFNEEPSSYEFPLAIIEGRPVFVGDELWYKKGYKIKIAGVDCISGFIAAGKDGYFSIDSLSWNPPKPRTVMVEMLREDAEEHAS
jgi:hypothetical protein